MDIKKMNIKPSRYKPINKVSNSANAQDTDGFIWGGTTCLCERCSECVDENDEWIWEDLKENILSEMKTLKRMGLKA